MRLGEGGRDAGAMLWAFALGADIGHGVGVCGFLSYGVTRARKVGDDESLETNLTAEDCKAGSLLDPSGESYLKCLNNNDGGKGRETF